MMVHVRLTNERTFLQKGKITYIPIYYIMFFNSNTGSGKVQF